MLFITEGLIRPVGKVLRLVGEVSILTKKVVLSLVLINLLFTLGAQASFEVGPVLPMEGLIIGAEGQHSFNQWGIYSKGGYDFEAEDVFYDFGSEYIITNDLTLSANYRKWFNHNLADYHYEQGIKFDLDYDKAWGEGFNLAVFSGEVAKLEEETVETVYFSSNYQNELYYSNDYNFERKANLLFDFSTGYTDDLDDIYYTSHLKLPIRLGEYRIIPELGYIKSSTRLNPQYHFEDYQVGHSEAIIGNKLINLALERRFDVFSQTEISGVELFDLITVVNFGDLLTAEQGINDFNLHASAGVGVAFEWEIIDFRLKAIVDEQGKPAIRFNIVEVY